MKSKSLVLGLALALLTSPTTFAESQSLDMDAASTEVSSNYGKAHPEMQEFVLETVRSFGRSGLWLNENAYAGLKPEERQARMAKDDFKADKQAWNKWWMGQGHEAIDPALLKPCVPPTGD